MEIRLMKKRQIRLAYRRICKVTFRKTSCGRLEIFCRCGGGAFTIATGFSREKGVYCKGPFLEQQLEVLLI